MEIKIYQINSERDKNRVAYLGYDLLPEYQGTTEIDSSIYDCVYTGLEAWDGLEGIYRSFNIGQYPVEFKGHSLSVSDIVEVVQDKRSDKESRIEPGFYYCDSVGWRKVNFDPDKAKFYEQAGIRVVMVEPGKEAREAVVGTTLEELYEALECECIQCLYPFNDSVCIICDDEGKIAKKKPNRALYDDDGNIYDVVCGKFIVCDTNGEDFASLDEDTFYKYWDKFLLPEKFVKIASEIHTIKYDPERKERIYNVLPVPEGTLPYQGGYRFSAAYMDDYTNTRFAEFFKTKPEAIEWIENQK